MKKKIHDMWPKKKLKETIEASISIVKMALKLSSEQKKKNSSPISLRTCFNHIRNGLLGNGRQKLRIINKKRIFFSYRKWRLKRATHFHFILFVFVDDRHYLSSKREIIDVRMMTSIWKKYMNVIYNDDDHHHNFIRIFLMIFIKWKNKIKTSTTLTIKNQKLLYFQQQQKNIYYFFG